MKKVIQIITNYEVITKFEKVQLKILVNELNEENIKSKTTE